MSLSFTAHRRVEYAHTDMAGIVHFSRFFTYIEEAEHEMWRSIGHPVHDTIDSIHYGWPRVSASIDFKAPLKFEDEFTITLSITNIGTRSLTYTADIERSGTAIASGKMSIVCCRVEDNGKLASADIPDVIRQSLTE